MRAAIPGRERSACLREKRDGSLWVYLLLVGRPDVSIEVNRVDEASDPSFNGHSKN